MTLPAGDVHLSRPLDLRGEARNLIVRGSATGTTLVMDAGFHGPAAILIAHGDNVTLTGFSIRGDRAALRSAWYLPLAEAAFADSYTGNGILVRQSRGVIIRNVTISLVRAFPILVNASAGVTIDSAAISDSGTLNSSGRNNTTGGVLFEEGVKGFEVAHSTIRRITGNAIWTHSYARSPRNAEGSIHDNEISRVGRDAIQIGHATGVTVVRNHGAELGFPVEIVDLEHHGNAVALDTSGNVDRTFYRDNHFSDVNGECLNLDGFHDGEVTGNSCINEKQLEAYPALHYAVIFGNNDPGMNSSGIVLRGNTMRGFAYGAVFLIGSGNRIENNRFTRINLAHCGSMPVSPRCNYALDQPDLLRSGIYLSDNGGRPTRTVNNVIEGNRIEGFGLRQNCIRASKKVDLGANRLRMNTCSD